MSKVLRHLVGAVATATLVMALLVPSSLGVAGAQAGRSRPNIVFVLTDDLAWNLVTPRFMPRLVALEHKGATFTDYFVSDSLCCPSRASIFTGRLPHDTHVDLRSTFDGLAGTEPKEGCRRQEPHAAAVRAQGHQRAARMAPRGARRAHGPHRKKAGPA